nr:hypothetical protein BaRGS_006852 [Batillaria attramentaria]
MSSPTHAFATISSAPAGGTSSSGEVTAANLTPIIHLGRKPWLTKFTGENAADYSLWRYQLLSLQREGHTEKDIKDAIRASLHGKAGYVVVRMGTGVTIQEIVAKMDSIYGQVKSEADVLASFYGAKQEETETVAEWGCRLEMLLDNVRQQNVPLQRPADVMLRTVLWTGLRQELKDVSAYQYDSITTSEMESETEGARRNNSRPLNATREDLGASGVPVVITELEDVPADVRETLLSQIDIDADHLTADQLKEVQDLIAQNESIFSKNEEDRLMENVLGDLHMKTCLIYLDDLIIFSRTYEEHLERLKKVFQRLSEAGWLAALAAYDFDIKYRPGEHNVDADTLSRLPGRDEEYASGDVSSEIVHTICGAVHCPAVETHCLSDTVVDMLEESEGQDITDFTERDWRRAQDADKRGRNAQDYTTYATDLRRRLQEAYKAAANAAEHAQRRQKGYYDTKSRVFSLLDPESGSRKEKFLKQKGQRKKLSASPCSTLVTTTELVQRTGRPV